VALEISKTFTIDAPRKAVWEFLTDPYKVARCLPGAAITQKVDDRSYTGTITVKVGPVSASYKGKGGADMRMQSRLTELAPNKTEVSATSQVNITGILAQVGARMIQDVSDQMLQKFTEAMQTQLGAPGGAAAGASAASTAAAPIDAVSLGAGVASRMLGRAVKRPAFWVVAVLVVFAIYWLWLRR